jgi:hypothetical protein
MLIWVEQIFTVYLLANPLPLGIQMVILPDANQCHMMQSVVSVIAVLGVEVIHILGGCTGLYQPLDVGINKLFKHGIHLLWEEWMMNMLDTDGKIREATRKEVAAWTAEVFRDMMGKKLLNNLWQKTEYNWFEGVVEEDVVEDDDDGDNSNKAYNNGNEDNNNDNKEVFSNGNDVKEEWEDREEDGA